MNQKSKPKRVWLVPLLLGAIIGGAVAFYLATRSTFTPPVVPQPNAYDTLLKAADRLAPRTGFYDEMEQAELEATVEQNQEALSMLREVLGQPSVVPVNWQPDQQAMQDHLEQSYKPRELARALSAESRLALLQQDLDTAVLDSLACLEMAPMAAQGGLMVERQIAMAVYRTGLANLRELVAQLTQQDCQRLRNKLQITSLQLEPIDDVIQRDLNFTRMVNGRMASLMMGGAVRRQVEQTKQQMAEADQLTEVLQDLLTVHLALREYQLDHSAYPEQLTGLVPNYLKQLPEDFFSKQPLKYRRTDDAYLLYSVGSDKTDDGGVEDENGQSDDVLIEPRW